MDHPLAHPLLGADDPDPVSLFGDGESSPFLIVCDHGGRAVPRALRRLGLPDQAFDLHIAWDIGILDLAKRLGAALGARVISQTYSRLVIDCNRPLGHPQSIPEISDEVVIPGNQGLGPEAIAARQAAIHAPYHDAIAREMRAREDLGLPTLLICLHSFTPVMGGFPRPWHIGVLHQGDSPASHALLDGLRREDDLIVGDNEPYAMGSNDHTAPFHALSRGLDALEIEVRQDMAVDPEGQARVVALLARLAPAALAHTRRVRGETV